MDTINTITLEDNQNYMIVDEINYQNITYIYLANVLDPEDFCVKKLIDNKDLYSLEDQKEFELALNIFNAKRGNEF